MKIDSARLKKLSDDQLRQLRAGLEVEMRRRGIDFSVGNIGESLVIKHFKNTPGLTNLQKAPKGTKNVDALSRDGDRYSIKTVWSAKKTGTIYPDPKDEEKQLFEYLIIAHLSDDLTLKSIHQFSWRVFAEVRLWDRRMSAWYLSCSKQTLAKGDVIVP